MEKSTMQSNQKTIILLISLTSTFLPSGCLSGREAVEVVVHPKRFLESAPQGPTVVESAMELSDKYARLSEETAVLRQQNHDIITKNKQLKDQLVAREAQLQQTQKELTEANDFLIEMRIELNDWKTDILGFREEIRGAETEQLRALLNILKILGGEAKAESDQGKDTSSYAVSATEPDQFEP
jgi:chromosome segregation ATPase